MRSLLSWGLTPLYASIVAALSLNAGQCGQDDDDTGSSRLKVGAAVVTILPEVQGSTSYFDGLRDQDPLALEPGDPGTDPGVFVEEWDAGTIAIGNGFPTSHWVHDEIRAGAVAFQDLDQPDGRTLVMVSVDVYMMFRQDIQDIYDKVRLGMGDDEAFNKLSIVVSATHNHMGPDTSGLDGINDAYYNYLTDQVSRAILMALDKDHLKYASLRVAQADHQFGLSDGDAPFIADPTLNVMQAVSTDDGSILATLMQWQNHPEDTLSFGRDVYATEEQADYLRSVDECYSDDDQAHCYIEGQYISAGFPGYAVWRVMQDTGAPALYFNGPVGSMLTPLDATIWETEGESGQPVGNGVDIPEGAVLIPRSFHKLAVNGNELGKRVLEALADAEEVIDPAIRIFQKQFYTRLTNWGFRVGLSLGPTGQPLMLGRYKRELYTCTEGVPSTDETCVSDNYASEPDPIMHLPTRIGTSLKTEAYYLQIGPVGMVSIPGEAVVETIEGLPSDFYTDPRNTYYYSEANKSNHAVGTAYDTNGYVRQAMPDRYRWALGLTQDELGYMVPLSDWRIFCVADEEDLGGQDGKCLELKSAGIMDYQSYDGDDWSISGRRCKDIREHPELLESSPYTDVEDGALWAQNTCYYGQAWDEADDHYVQTMSAGWDFAADYTETVKSLLGYTGELEDVNPDFIGNNQTPD